MSNPSQWTAKELRENCSLDTECQELLKNAVHQLRLTSHDHDEILRAAKTISLDDGGVISTAHLAKAIEAFRAKP